MPSLSPTPPRSSFTGRPAAGLGAQLVRHRLSLQDHELSDHDQPQEIHAQAAAMQLEFIFKIPFVLYSPEEIRTIRLTLGETTAQFAQRFKAAESTIKGWEAPMGSASHRDCEGANATIMWICAHLANTKAGSIGQSIRMASAYGVTLKLSPLER